MCIRDSSSKNGYLSVETTIKGGEFYVIDIFDEEHPLGMFNFANIEPPPPGDDTFNGQKLDNIEKIMALDERGVPSIWYGDPLLSEFSDLHSLKNGKGYIVTTKDEVSIPWNFWAAPTLSLARSHDCSNLNYAMVGVPSDGCYLPAIPPIFDLAFSSSNPTSKLEVISSDSVDSVNEDINGIPMENLIWRTVGNYEQNSFVTHSVRQINEDGEMSEVFNNTPDFVDGFIPPENLHTLSASITVWVRDKTFPHVNKKFVVSCPIAPCSDVATTVPVCPDIDFTYEQGQDFCDSPEWMAECQANGNSCSNGGPRPVQGVQVIPIVDENGCVTQYNCLCLYDECPPYEPQPPATTPTVTTSTSQPSCEERGFLTDVDQCECFVGMYQCPNGTIIHMSYIPFPILGINGCVTDCSCGEDPDLLDNDGTPLACGVDIFPEDVPCPMCDTTCDTLECPMYNDAGEEIGISIVDSVFPDGHIEEFDLYGVRISCECGPCSGMLVESCEELYDDPTYRPPGMVQDEDGNWITTTTVTPVTPNRPDEGFIGHGGGGSAGDITPAITTVLATPQPAPTQPAPPSSSVGGSVDCRGRFLDTRICQDIECEYRAAHGYACTVLEPGEAIPSSLFATSAVNPCVDLTNLGKDGFIVGVYDDDGCQIGCSCVDMAARHNPVSNLWEIPTTTIVPYVEEDYRNLRIQNIEIEQEGVKTIVSFDFGTNPPETYHTIKGLNVSLAPTSPIPNFFGVSMAIMSNSFGSHTINYNGRNSITLFPSNYSDTTDINFNTSHSSNRLVPPQLDGKEVNISISPSWDSQNTGENRYGAVSDAGITTLALGASECLDNSVDVTVVNQGGKNKYAFNGLSSRDYKFKLGIGTYVFNNVPEDHAIAFHTNGSNTYAGAVGKGKIALDGQLRNYFFDTVTLTINDNQFETISYECWSHGYMGGENNLQYDLACQDNPCDGKYTPIEYGTAFSTYRNNTTFWTSVPNKSIMNNYSFLHNGGKLGEYTNDSGKPIIWSMEDNYVGDDFSVGDIITIQQSSGRGAGSPSLQAGSEFRIADVLLDSPFNDPNQYRGPGLVLDCDTTPTATTGTPTTTTNSFTPEGAITDWRELPDISNVEIEQNGIRTIISFDFGSNPPATNHILNDIEVNLDSEATNIFPKVHEFFRFTLSGATHGNPTDSKNSDLKFYGGSSRGHYTSGRSSITFAPSSAHSGTGRNVRPELDGRQVTVRLRPVWQGRDENTTSPRSGNTVAYGAKINLPSVNATTTTPIFLPPEPRGVSFSNSLANARSFNNVLMINFNFGNVPLPEGAVLTHINMGIMRSLGNGVFLGSHSSTMPVRTRSDTIYYNIPETISLQYGDSQIGIVSSDSPLKTFRDINGVLRDNDGRYLSLPDWLDGNQAQISLKATYELNGGGNYNSETVIYPELITLPGNNMNLNIPNAATTTITTTTTTSTTYQPPSSGGGSSGGTSSGGTSSGGSSGGTSSGGSSGGGYGY